MSQVESHNAVGMTSRADIELLNAIRARLPLTRLIERRRFGRELDRLYSRRQRGADFEQACATLAAAVDASIAKLERLRSLPLLLHYDPALPITSHHDEVLAALEQNQVIVLCGATGSGKTTQLPKFCLEAGRGTLGLIGHTQPRRIAARALAARLASELNTTVGGAVGYQVRFNDRSGPDCRVKLMTDGILLKELEGDRYLNRYDTIIIDEAHERSLNIDLLLGVLKRLLPKRPDLKLIVTSATIDPQKFSKFFDDAPIIEVSGRSYPVEVRYRPLEGDDEESAELSLPEGVVAAVRELDSAARGDVLVFLPGEKQIRECDDALRRAKLGNTEVLPLFSRLSTRDQERIFEGHAQRRVVLATNVAETSLTVPGIRNVIDSGLARISRYSVRGKVQRLPIERIAQASADQRKGRCGRESEGVCIRLYSEDDFTAREEFTPPEVLRTNLASVILRLAVLGLGEPGDFAFIDPPDTRLINDGYRLLQELKAVDDDRRVTALGKQVAALPIDPRLARMLIAAGHHGCAAEMLILAAFLEIQDPRERPADAQTQADQAHAMFADPRSDFVAVLNLWNAFHKNADELSGNQLRKWCREHFLSFIRMREWQELHRQLKDAVEDIDLRVNQQPAHYADLHQAILTGFLGQIGTLDEKREYLGARGARFTIAPGTPLASKPPKWVVAGSIVETTRVFARMVASVEPQWIERAGEHLLKRSYAEPQWVEQKGFVAASESVSLYGLLLVGQRRVNYGSVAPKEAREIFVREALVEGKTTLRAEFLRHNAELIAQVERMEAKIRRRDILVDEQSLCDFYLQRLPAHINSIAAIDKWMRGERHRGGRSGEFQADTLRMSLVDAVRRDTSEITDQLYPDYLPLKGNRLALTYKFEPNEVDDGVTIAVPQPLLNELSAEQLAWAVPGWRLEKVTALLRALPKDRRRHFVPVPDAAKRCLGEVDPDAEFTSALAIWIARESGNSIDAEQLLRLPIPEFLRVNVRVVGLDGRFVCQGRDLVNVKREARAGGTPRTPRSANSGATSTIYRAWEFGDLPETRDVTRGGIRFTVYPAIQVQNDGVVLGECASQLEAEALIRRAVVRLAVLSLPQQAKFVRKLFSDNRELVLLTQGMPTSKPFADLFVERVFANCFTAGDGAMPRTRNAFEARLERGRAQLSEAAESLATRLLDTMKLFRAVRQQLDKLEGSSFLAPLDDIRNQLEELLPADFLTHISDEYLQHLPRYLRAIQRRLERLPGNVNRDAELMRALQPTMQAIAQLAGKALVQPELDKLRWMLQEYRVSLFAQDLKTAIPVSDKRLAEQVQRARQESLG